MTAYPFALLCLFLLVPGAVIFAAAPRLRRAQLTVMGFALPFAFTEVFFYPDYWEPRFLFDLARHIGFGIEDFLFVAGLGATVPVLHPFVARLSFVPFAAGDRPRRWRMLAPVLVALALSAASFMAGVPVIWSCVPIMAGIAVAICVVRRDLWQPAFFGALEVAALYFALCLALGRAIPGVFALHWHAENFSNVFLLGVPLEEVAYAFAAGGVGTVFYPFAFSQRFAKIGATGEVV